MTHRCHLPWQPRRGQVHQCMCGQWWRTVAVNDVFTGEPLRFWDRVPWWDLRTRYRIWSRYKR